MPKKKLPWISTGLGEKKKKHKGREKNRSIFYMSARNTSSSLKYSPHTNWVELSAWKRFLLVVIHMRMLLPVTSQQGCYCASYGASHPHGMAGKATVEDMNWQEGGVQTSGKDVLLRTSAGAGEGRQQEKSTPGHKGKEKQVAAMRFASQRPPEPLRTYSRWAQASTGYRKHSAWF